MKKKPFNTNYPKPFEKVHVPNKIETNLEGFEKECFDLEEYYKNFPNSRKINNIICTPSSCPLTFLCIPSGQSTICSKCGKIVNSNSPTF